MSNPEPGKGPNSAPRSERLPVAQLLLDPDNPRLVFTKQPSQSDLLRRLYEDESLDELMPSLRDNGFFEEEPLVVIPNKNRVPGGDWICVEGNRRLATVKLLLNERLRKEADVDDWPVLTEEARKRLEILPTVVYQQREDVLPFLGFRHITGAKKWEPFQKARFIARLVDEGREIDDIQDLIGDTTQTVKRLYQDYLIYKEIELSDPTTARRIRRRFSLLEVTLNQRPIKEYLGMPSRLPREAVSEPLVPTERREELATVVEWVFGSDTKDPVVSESRDISKLAKVVEDEAARGYLERTDDLESAFEYAGGELEYLLRRLGRAERLIADATAIAAQYAENPTVQSAANRLEKASRGLLRMVRT